MAACGMTWQHVATVSHGAAAKSQLTVEADSEPSCEEDHDALAVCQRVWGSSLATFTCLQLVSNAVVRSLEVARARRRQTWSASAHVAEIDGARACTMDHGAAVRQPKVAGLHQHRARAQSAIILPCDAGAAWKLRCVASTWTTTRLPRCGSSCPLRGPRTRFSRRQHSVPPRVLGSCPPIARCRCQRRWGRIDTPSQTSVCQQQTSPLRKLSDFESFLLGCRKLVGHQGRHAGHGACSICMGTCRRALPGQFICRHVACRKSSI